MFWWLPVGRVPDISATELHTHLAADNSVHIVDIRSAAEWRRSHIPGAVSVPIHALKDRLAALQLDAQQPIIAICLSAHRSIPAVRLLRAQGFENALQQKSGMLAWWKSRRASRPFTASTRIVLGGFGRARRGSASVIFGGAGY